MSFTCEDPTIIDFRFNTASPPDIQNTDSEIYGIHKDEADKGQNGIKHNP
jgi:hypothetical protein